MVRVRLPERLHGRVLEAATSDGLTLSGWLRKAILDRLGDASREAAELAALVAEAKRYIATHPNAPENDVISGQLGLLEAVKGRMSVAEQHGRRRALEEIAGGALQPVDGDVLVLSDYRTNEVPVVLERAAPLRRRGFLQVDLATQQAMELLEVASKPRPRAVPAGVIGERAARELFRQAVRWGGAETVFCPTHTVVPTFPDDPSRCYLGCELPADDGPEAA
jgi:hypothetical protein